jgi:hypothetical protein
MSSSGKNINNKFDGYEPEVPDGKIDQDWEKIKYFLPQEKKRRGFIFLRNRGLQRFLAFAVVAAVGSVIFTYRQTLFQKNDLSENNKLPRSEKKVWAAGERVSDHNVKQRAGSSFQGTPSQKNEAVRVSIGQEKQTNVPPETSGPVTQKEQVQIYQDPVTDPNPPSTNENVPLEKIKPADGSYSPEDSVTFLRLNPIVIGSLPGHTQNDSIQPSFAFIKKSYLPPDLNFAKWTIELTGGPQWAANSVSYTATDIETISRQLSLGFGLGVVYQFGSQWSANAQAGVNGNKLNYRDEATGNKMVGKEPSFTTTGPGPGLVPADTIVSYVKVHSQNSLSSKISYNLCLGAGYRLVQRNRIFADVFIQISGRSSVYSFKSRNYEDRDTMKFVQRSPSAGLGNQVKTVDDEYGNKYSVKSLGVIPGLTLGYRINNRLSVVAKPACFIQLSITTIAPEQKTFRLKQNNLFIPLGIRFTL